MKNIDIRHILVIRFRRVGDSVLSMALCASLRRTFPNAQIDYVINEGIHILYENHPDLDRLIVFSEEEKHKLFPYLAKVWRTMRQTHYDVIIDMRTTIQTLWFSLFSLGSPYRIGSRKLIGTLILNHRVSNHADVSLDMVRQDLMLLDPLSACATVNKTENFKLYVDIEYRKCFKLYMQEQGIDFSKPVVVVTPAVRLAHKEWNRERMKEILHRLIDNYDAQLVFNFSDNAEHNTILWYQKKLNYDSHVYTNIEARNLKDLCALICNCDFFFGNEGGHGICHKLWESLHLPSFLLAFRKRYGFLRRENAMLASAQRTLFPLNSKIRKIWIMQLVLT